MMTANQYSYRALQYWAQVFFPAPPLPSLSTLWYRLVHIPEARWHAFLTWLAEQGIAQERAQRAGSASAPPLVLVDGTGVDYNMLFYQRLGRGAQILSGGSLVRRMILLVFDHLRQKEKQPAALSAVSPATSASMDAERGNRIKAHLKQAL